MNISRALIDSTRHRIVPFYIYHIITLVRIITTFVIAFSKSAKKKVQYLFTILTKYAHYLKNLHLIVVVLHMIMDQFVFSLIKDSLFNKEHVILNQEQKIMLWHLAKGLKSLLPKKIMHSKSGKLYTLILTFGDLKFAKNNISNNKCGCYSSYYNYLSGNSGICNYSSFIENIQINGESLFFGSLGGLNQTLSYCNIIGNKFGNHSIISSEVTTNVDHCIFLKNENYMFIQQKNDRTITISDSYFDSVSTTGSGSVTFVNPNKACNFNNFSHFHTEICFVELYKFSNKVTYNSKIAKTSATGLMSSKK